MTDISPEQWKQNLEEAMEIFGEWKEPEVVWRHHQIRRIREPRKKWWMGAPLAKDKWDKRRATEIENQIESLIRWNKSKNTLALIDRDYVEMKLFEVLREHRPEEVENVFKEIRDQESPTEEEVILGLYGKSLSVRAIARKADFPEEVIKGIIKNYEMIHSYTPTDSLTKFLKLLGETDEYRKSASSIRHEDTPINKHPSPTQRINKITVTKSEWFLLIVIGVIIIILVLQA